MDNRVNIDRVLLHRLVTYAKRWALFNEPDSLENQILDNRLAMEARAAKETLLDLIQKLP